MTSKHNIDRRLTALAGGRTDYQVQDFWQRSAAGEDPLADPEYAARFARAAEENGSLDEWFE